MEKTKRIDWLDLVRAGAILLVVACHAVEGVYTFSTEYMFSVSVLSRVFAFAVFSAGRLGVPLFLMISGYLLLDRTYSGEDYRKFLFGKVLRLALTAALWLIIYYLFLTQRSGGAVELSVLLRQMLFLNAPEYTHAWYLPMLLGIYLLLPVMANGLNSLDANKLYIPIAVLAAYVFVPTTLAALLRAFGKGGFDVQLGAGFSGGAYGIYLIFGYLVRKGSFKKLPAWCVAALAAAGFVGVMWIQHISYNNGVSYNVWYNDVFLMICAVCVFELASRLRRIPLMGIVRFVSRYAFGVYLTHNIVRTCLRGAVCEMAAPQPVRVAVLYGAMVLLPLAFSAIAERIPKVGKAVLYLK